MARYRIEFTRKARKAFDDLPKAGKEAVSAALEKIAEDPRNPNVIKMRGIGVSHRMRVGDYRIVFEIHDGELLVTVLDLGTRQGIYKR
jgi:mRNA interferase RelE/StbE